MNDSMWDVDQELDDPLEDESMLPLSRAKRAADFSSMTITMTEEGYSTVAATKVGYGDHYTYKLEIALPQTAEADKFDLDVEIFSVQPTTG